MNPKMSVDIAWNNIMNALNEFKGKGTEWRVLFESVDTLKPLVDAAMAETKKPIPFPAPQPQPQPKPEPLPAAAVKESEGA